MNSKQVVVATNQTVNKCSKKARILNICCLPLILTLPLMRTTFIKIKYTKSQRRSVRRVAASAAAVEIIIIMPFLALSSKIFSILNHLFNYMTMAELTFVFNT